MGPRYRRVAVIGTGPAGISTIKALSDEKAFDTIKAFERRERLGGTWILDPIPDVFPYSPLANRKREPPSQLPALTPPAPEDPATRTSIYPALDSNVGAEVMAFTYKPFAPRNSATSVERYGHDNPTRPWHYLAQYLEDIARPYLHLIAFNTTVEKVAKDGQEWVVTLRRPGGQLYPGEQRDYWWQERFDAVVGATGHYTVQYIPDIEGLAEMYEATPEKFEHSKMYRSPDNYVDQRVVVIGGSASAGDIVSDLHAIVKGPLHLSQRGRNEALEKAWTLPNVVRKPPITRLSPAANGTVTFADGSTLTGIDKLIFATGYRLSYPYLHPHNPVTPENRLAGFYQHIFSIPDPSLAIVGQVKSALSFRVYEYQAVAVARFFARRSARPLPSEQEQRDWERKRLAYKGPTNNFHEIKPDFEEYFTWLTEFAGEPAEGTDAYKLPPWQEGMAEKGFAIIALKDKYWGRIGGRIAAPVEKARL